jgi:hypothetical protein
MIARPFNFDANILPSLAQVTSEIVFISAPWPTVPLQPTVNCVLHMIKQCAHVIIGRGGGVGRKRRAVEGHRPVVDTF